MTIVKMGKEEVDLNQNNLNFDETTLTNYLQKEGGFYNNFGANLAKAEFILQRRQLELDALYGKKFKEYKDTEGGSDKLNEMKTDSDPDVIEAREKVIGANYRVNLLKQHLKAWDKNHENAQSMGHFLRKEMDKLNADILGAYRTDKFNSGFNAEDLDSKITHFKADGTV